MDRAELSAWLRLGETPGVGPETARRLLAAFALPQTVFDAGTAALLQVVSADVAQALRRMPDGLPALCETTWAWLNENDASGAQRCLVTLGDPRYPPALLTIEDPPLVLYAMGRPLPGPQVPAIAIVGTRNPTPQGVLDARAFAGHFAAAGMVVVSGLAQGIDGAAHEGALEGAPADSQASATIAVVGTGLDRVYPRQHRVLAHRIAERGTLLSEYPLGTPPMPHHFPRRNRLISGLTLGTLVIEATQPSGSLITARVAAEQGREVFAMPGSIHSPQSRGCHALIRQGAKLVESAQDVLEELRFPPGPGGAPAVPEPSDDPLLAHMGHVPVGLDALVARTGFDAATLQVQLLDLELDGQVARLPGGLYQRIVSA